MSDSGSLFPGGDRQSILNIAAAIVTNNHDPENLGRVKVKFPRMSDENESGWIRCTTFMAGDRRGGYFLPEVGDEVLVAFEHGDVNCPYVIGALWNAKAKPPEDNEDGDNNIRMIKSRSGHRILLDDTRGRERIEIVDKTGANKCCIDSASNTVNIESTGTINIKAQDININGTSSVNIDSAKINESGTGSVTIVN